MRSPVIRYQGLTFAHAKWSLPDWYKGGRRYDLVTTLEPSQARLYHIHPTPRQPPRHRIHLQTPPTGSRTFAHTIDPNIALR